MSFISFTYHLYGYNLLQHVFYILPSLKAF